MEPAPQLKSDAAGVELRPLSFYSRQLRAHLPDQAFEPHPMRLLWFVGFGAVAVLSLLLIRDAGAHWSLKALLGLIAGTCFGGLGFFSHELQHGSVVRNKATQNILGFICNLPYFISPTFWKYWHNQLHHGRTQAILADPDAYPPLKIYKHSRFMKFMFPFTPGSGHKRSFSYFAFWFSFHVFVAQVYLRFRNSLFDKLDHKRVTIEMSTQIILWCGFLYWLGPSNLIYTFVLPVIAQNYFAMSYISTNHNLSPLTKINDPLVNSLTVTNHPVLEWLHLNFGYHVEHHIFPTMSGVHTKKVHKLLKDMYPEEYRYMPKSQAVAALYKTARIYKNSTTLINPKTGKTYSTI